MFSIPLHFGMQQQQEKGRNSDGWKIVACLRSLAYFGDLHEFGWALTNDWCHGDTLLVKGKTIDKYFQFSSYGFASLLLPGSNGRHLTPVLFVCSVANGREIRRIKDWCHFSSGCVIADVEWKKKNLAFVNPNEQYDWSFLIEQICNCFGSLLIP